MTSSETLAHCDKRVRRYTERDIIKRIDYSKTVPLFMCCCFGVFFVVVTLFVLFVCLFYCLFICTFYVVVLKKKCCFVL